MRGGEPFDDPDVHQPPVRPHEVEGNRAAAPIRRPRPVDLDRGPPARVPQRGQLVQQPAGEAPDTRVDRVDPDPFDEREPLLDGRQREEVQRSVLEPGLPVRHRVPVALDAHGGDRAAGEPRPVQPGQRLLTGEEAADSGRIAEQLVQRDRDEVRLPLAEVEPVRRHERRTVHQHVPAGRLCSRNPLERVLDAREVRLRRVGEQVAVPTVGVPQQRLEHVLVDAQRGRRPGHVRGRRARSARELANPVHRVVVVGREQKAAAGAERVRLPHQPERAGRVCREDDGVFLRRRVEVAQHGPPRSLHQLGCLRRGRAVGVRVAEHLRPSRSRWASSCDSA